MSGWRFAIVVALLLPATAPADPDAVRAAAQSRAGDLLFKVPPGWERKDQDGAVVLVPPGLDQGQSYQIHIQPARPARGTLREDLRQELDAARQAYKDVQETAVVEQRHATGYDLVLVGFSMEHKTQPGQFAYCILYLARVAQQVQPIVVVCNSAPLYAQYQNTSTAFFNSIRFTSLIVLAEGPPPLTQGDVNQVADFVEWLLEVPMTDGQRDAIRDDLVESWRKHDRREMDGLAEIPRARAQLSAMTPAQREVARQTLQPQVVKAWRQENTRICRLMVEIYDSAHKPIAPGEPPLTRQAADATIELLYFMACQVDGGGEIQPAPAVKDEWARKLSADYASMGEEAKKGIAQMPLTWAAVRFAWPGVPDAEKNKLKEQWGQVQQIRELGASLAKIRAEAAASKTQSMADLYRKMQESRQNYQALSNMSRMMHETNMTIIRNMSSNRYEYRYRYR